MKTANFTNEQFITATGSGGLNTAFGTTSGAIASVGSGAWSVPGVLAPEAMTVGFASLVANIGLPSPWGLVTSGGVVVRAHGTQTGQDTTTYHVDFSSLIPATGTVTAYLAATVQAIQQTPIAVPGPPQGHPSFNPNYVPTIGYAQSVLSIALSATASAPNNASIFELFRTTLSAGQSSISTYSTVGRQPAGERLAWPPLYLASGGVLTPAQAQFAITATNPGLTLTVPASSGSIGLLYRFINSSSGNLTISRAASPDLIYGLGGSGVTSLVVPVSGSAILEGVDGGYEIIAASPNMPGSANPTATAGPTAVNGSAATFMRSDAAPAVQTATTGQLGLVQPDGTTIGISGGVISAVGVGHNPTATAGPTAVNGSAATFMRSDGAPAVQTATTGQLGLVQPDGTTIGISGGVISAVGVGHNPTATAGPTAVNGSAATFMRSDAAPAVQTATTGQLGLVQPDGTSIRIATGVISATPTANIVVLTASSGSFTVPDNTYSIDVEAWGGGGGSGATTGSATNNCGSTGGGGGYSRDSIGVTPGQVIPFTNGAGGSAGLSGGTAPGDGGTTTFGSLSAGGGGHGTNGTAGGPPTGGGSGGSSSGGTLNYPGQNGSSFTLNGALGVVTALGGGASYTFPSITAFSGDHVGTTPSWPGVAGVPAITDAGNNYNGGTGAAGQIIIHYWN